MFWASKVWNRPTYEKSPLSGPDYESPHLLEISRTSLDHQKYESSNLIQSIALSRSKDNGNSSYHNSPLNTTNKSTANDISISDHVDNQQPFGTASLLLPPQPLLKESNEHLLRVTPLKISVKKATKYLGLSKSHGIKVGCSRNKT